MSWLRNLVKRTITVVSPPVLRPRLRPDGVVIHRPRLQGIESKLGAVEVGGRRCALLSATRVEGSVEGRRVGHDDGREDLGGAPDGADCVRAAVGEDLVHADDGDGDDEEADAEEEA